MPHAVALNPIIKEIESTLQEGSAEKRIKILMSVTDLFVDGASQRTEAETRLFDDVMLHLIKHVENRALIELSTRLAPVDNAPLETIRSLARHDAIEISGPVLTRSARLNDDDLIEIAKTKSHAHLASIAHRPIINAPVTDVLVDHGNADVVNEVAANVGARVSQLTMAKLVLRADGDDRLAGTIGRRPDIPPAMFRQLMLQATEAVRAKMLASANAEQKAAIQEVMDQISAQIGQKPAVRNYAKAKHAVSSFSQDTDLTRMKILEFADSHRIPEMIASLSVLSGVSIEELDKLFHATNAFGLMVLCRSIALGWNTALAVITARQADTESSDDFRVQYEELSAESAQKLIHFWLGRQKVAARLGR